MASLGQHQSILPPPLLAHRHFLNPCREQPTAGSVNGFRAAHPMTANNVDTALGKVLIAADQGEEPLCDALTAVGYGVQLFTHRS
jgi:hypothetical protein